MLKKLFPFLFKEKKPEKKAPTKSEPAKPGPNRKPAQTSAKHNRPHSKSAPGTARKQEASGNRNQPPKRETFGLIAENKSHKTLRTGSQVHVRQIFDNGARFRVRGESEEGKQITIVLSSKHLHKFEVEEIPPYLRKFYKKHSLFNSKEEARNMAGQLNA